LAARRTYVFIGIIVGVAIIIGVVFGAGVFRRPPSAISDVEKPEAVEPRIYPPDSEPYGLTYADWSARWWQWVMSMSETDNPLTDDTGKSCANNQSGPVWFLVGTSGGKVVRECGIPAGKAIFFPIINGECNAVLDNVRTEEEFRNCIIPFVDQVNHVEATIDEVKLQGPQSNIEYYLHYSMRPLLKTIPMELHKEPLQPCQMDGGFCWNLCPRGGMRLTSKEFKERLLKGAGLASPLMSHTI
jgi:hypothetical protein